LAHRFQHLPKVLLTSMPSFICTTCGTQYAQSAMPTARCDICAADGRHAPIEGAAWTTLGWLRSGRQNLVQRVEPHLFSVGSIPRFAGGQRALLLRTAAATCSGTASA
jgi:hypothetical protein